MKSSQEQKMSLVEKQNELANEISQKQAVYKGKQVQLKALGSKKTQLNADLSKSQKNTNNLRANLTEVRV